MIKHIRNTLMAGMFALGLGIAHGGVAIADQLGDAISAYNRHDYPTALRTFRTLAEQGNASGQDGLGVMYEHGQGVAKNEKEAVKWYRLAADQGDAQAQFDLGVMYSQGRGVAQDYVRAHMWFNLAAANGNAGAVKKRDAVAHKMTREQIAQAQEMATKCKAANYKNCD